MRGNARVCLLFLPFWSIPYSLSFFYLSLYLRECGVSDAQLGVLVTAGAGASIVFSFLAAPVVDWLGRKKSTLIFDIVGSALPFLLYAVRGSFAFALAGTLLSNASRIMNIAYYLLMTEDSGNDEKTRSFNIFNIVVIASGLLVPVAGGLVERLGVVVAERWFLVLSAVVMVAGALGRNHFARETSAGKALAEARRNRPTPQVDKPARLSLGRGRPPRGVGMWQAATLRLWKPYRAALSYVATHRRAAAAVAANMLFYVYYIIGTNNSLYFAPFFADALGIDAAGVSAVGAVFSGGTLCAMLVLNPILFRRMSPGRCAAVGAALNFLGFVPLVFIPRGGIFWTIVAVGTASLGYGLLKSAIDAALATCFEDAPADEGISAGDEARSGVYSLANLISSVLGMGAGALCAVLYPSAPRSIPLISAIILAAICAVLALPGRDRAERRR